MYLRFLSKFVRSTFPDVPGAHRAFLFISYRRDMAVHGLSVRGWHQTNIAAHAVCVALIFGLLRSVFSIQGAVLGAALFAAHPVATSAVASIAGRSSVLCGVFYFAALLCAIIGGWAWLCVPVLWWLALGSKEEAALWPLAAAVTLLVTRFQ